jgi:hypothetical protein
VDRLIDDNTGLANFPGLKRQWCALWRRDGLASPIIAVRLETAQRCRDKGMKSLILRKDSIPVDRLLPPAGAAAAPATKEAEDPEEEVLVALSPMKQRRDNEEEVRDMAGRIERHLGDVLRINRWRPLAPINRFFLSHYQANGGDQAQLSDAHAHAHAHRLSFSALAGLEFTPSRLAEPSFGTIIHFDVVAVEGHFFSLNLQRCSFCSSMALRCDCYICIRVQFVRQTLNRHLS